MQRLLLFGLLFVHCAVFAIMQKDSTAVTYDTAPLKVKQIDNEDLQKYRADDAFDYELTKTERTWWDDFKTWLGNLLLRLFEGIFGVEKAVGFLAIFLRIVPYLLLGILLYLLIKFFLNVNARALQQAKSNQSLVSLSEEEHIIKNENIQELIQQALADKNYRLAVRFYYLYILKLLTEKELIAWELQKTNDDYLKEITKVELKKPFSDITRLYDYIWYGDFPIDEIQYDKVEKAFVSLQKIMTGNG